jgi:hypothetical protein
VPVAHSSTYWYTHPEASEHTPALLGAVLAEQKELSTVTPSSRLQCTALVWNPEPQVSEHSPQSPVCHSYEQPFSSKQGSLDTGVLEPALQWEESAIVGTLDDDGPVRKHATVRRVVPTPHIVEHKL